MLAGGMMALPLVVAPAVASAMLAAALVLAIFKPSWRLRSGLTHDIRQ
jgi:hypothetical protein